MTHPARRRDPSRQTLARSGPENGVGSNRAQALLVAGSNLELRPKSRTQTTGALRLPDAKKAPVTGPFVLLVLSNVRL